MSIATLYLDLCGNNNTKSSSARFEAMANAVRRIDANKIPGVIVETGVWFGGNIVLARKLSPDRVCWLYDTFTGMTEPTDLDHKVGHADKKAMASYKKKADKGERWAEAPLDDVRRVLQRYDVLDDTRLKFVVGPVEQTLLVPENIPDQIALLRLDTDWYASTKMAMEVLYPKLVVGGVLIVDDYGHWAGARKAVDDYFTGKPLFFWTRIDYTGVSMVKYE